MGIEFVDLPANRYIAVRLCKGKSIFLLLWVWRRSPHETKAKAKTKEKNKHNDMNIQFPAIVFESGWVKAIVSFAFALEKCAYRTRPYRTVFVCMFISCRLFHIDTSSGWSRELSFLFSKWLKLNGIKTIADFICNENVSMVFRAHNSR